eukprot:366322-Chlamydomonas_euryale.AAC.2
MLHESNSRAARSRVTGLGSGERGRKVEAVGLRAEHAFAAAPWFEPVWIHTAATGSQRQPATSERVR